MKCLKADKVEDNCSDVAVTFVRRYYVAVTFTIALSVCSCFEQVVNHSCTIVSCAFRSALCARGRAQCYISSCWCFSEYNQSKIFKTSRLYAVVHSSVVQTALYLLHGIIQFILILWWIVSTLVPTYCMLPLLDLRPKGLQYRRWVF